MNRACCALTGYDADEMVGRSWETLVLAKDRPLVQDGVRASDRGKVELYLHGVRKDGGTFEMHLAIVPAGDGEARPIVPKGHYFYLRDLAERRRMENQLI